jgi:hypothetical protein
METKERKSPLTGSEGSEIDIKVAAEWTQNHRHHSPDEVISQFFGREILQKILEQPGCVGIRFYYANAKSVGGWSRFMKKCFKRNSGEPHLIITGVTKDGHDQLPGSEQIPASENMETFALKATAAGAAPAKSTIGEQSVPCPGGAGCPQNVLTGGN